MSMHSYQYWIRELHHANNRGDGFANIVLAIQRDALTEACNAIARIDRATLSLKAGEFELQGWRDAKAALAVAENTVRYLIPTTTGGEGV